MLLAFAIILGVYPALMFDLMDNSINVLVHTLDTGVQNAVGVETTAQSLLGK